MARNPRATLPSLLSALAACSIAVPPPAAGQDAAPSAPDPLASYLTEADLREIGPAIMGGRIADLAVNERNPSTFYVGFATGGLWKTTSAGMAWEPLFDGQPNASIGAVTLAPSNPNVVWVGTGEPQNRNSTPYGAGVFRSLDGGRTWHDLGLHDTRHIARIVVHPRDQDVAYVAAVGHLFGPNEERGVYRTTDGGENWEKILYQDENTGAIDLVMDPGDPNTLFAATYQRRRTAFGFSASGGGGGIWRTLDGGESWTRLAGEGLPQGEIGRVGLDIWAGDGNVVYATIESEERQHTGLYRSTDRGESWEMMSNRNPRPMYFSLVRIDPGDLNRIYLGGVSFSISDDGGRTWWEGDAAEGIHVDHHALWIDPSDPEHVLLGTDGGLAVTEDGGRHWRQIDNMAVGQFYEIGYDMQDPYWVCGGLQDNSSWCAPQNSLNEYGIRNGDWIDVSGGDGFYNQIDPTDPTIIYSESQGGNLVRRDMTTGEAQRIRPEAWPTEDTEDTGDTGDTGDEPDEEDEERDYRFNWNTPIKISHHDPATIYFGSQHLLRSPDRGLSWQEISPDLTRAVDRDTLSIMGRPLSEPHLSRNDGVANYGNITDISESHFDPGVIWVGTDDGNLQITRDGGATWSNVVENVPGLPERTYVARIDASHHAPGRVYVAFDGHLNDDYAAYVYLTEDHGESFTRITDGLPMESVNVVREHPDAPNLLFVGNEVGAFVSVDRGSSWHRLEGDFPTVPVDDLAIHPREDDLILGTHGRSVWILDDLQPLQAMAGGSVERAASALFEPRDGTQWSIAGGWPFWGDEFQGENPEVGVWIRFYIGDDVAEGPTLEILDEAGAVVRELEVSGEPGYQQVLWDFRMDGPYESEGGGGFFGAPRGPRVLPGSYTVRLTANDVGHAADFEVRLDPRIEITRADLLARHEAMMTTHRMAAPVHYAEEALETLGERLERIRGLLDEAGEVSEELTAELDSLEFRLEELDDELGEANGAVRTGFSIDGSTTVPTADQLREIDEGWDTMVRAIERVNTMITETMPAFVRRVLTAEVRPAPLEPIEIPEREGG